VAPESRARQKVVDASEAAKSDQIKALQSAIETAQSAESAAKRELERASVALSESGDRCRKLEAQVEALTSKLASVEADKSAAEALLTEVSAKAAEAEERAMLTDATAKMKADSKPEKSERRK